MAAIAKVPKGGWQPEDGGLRFASATSGLRGPNRSFVRMVRITDGATQVDDQKPT